MLPIEVKDEKLKRAIELRDVYETRMNIDFQIQRDELNQCEIELKVAQTAAADAQKRLTDCLQDLTNMYYTELVKLDDIYGATDVDIEKKANDIEKNKTQINTLGKVVINGTSDDII